MSSETTPKLGKREQNRRDRYESILTTSFDIVEREGLAGLTIQRLSKEIGWAVGAVYRYYSSKDELILALELRAVRLIEEELLRAIRSDESPVESLSRMAEAYAKLPETMPQAFTLASLMLGDPLPYLEDSQAAPVMDEVFPFLSKVATYFHKAAEAKELTPGNALHRTIVFWLAIHGTTQGRKMQRFDRDLFVAKVMTRTCYQALFLGWGAPKETLTRLEASL